MRVPPALPILAVALGMLAPGAAAQTPGSLQVLPAGCLIMSNNPIACTAATTTGRPHLSPDGRHVYMVRTTRIAIASRDPATGALAPIAGPAGCIADDGAASGCIDARQLRGVSSLAFSPDGLQVYATAEDDNAIAILERDPATGALTQKAGTAGCINAAGADGCQGGAKMLAAPQAIAMRPGGAHLYIASTGIGGKALLAFARNPANGNLAQLTGNAAYIHSSACQPGVACTATANVSLIRGLAFDSAGNRLYAVDYSRNALLRFDIGTAPAGGLTQAQCLRTGVQAGCVTGRGLYGATEIAITADGRNLYTHSPSRKAVGVFALADGSGAIAQLAGASGCLGLDSAANRADQCATLDLIDTESYGLAASPDGASVYLGGWQLAILARDRTLGTLSGLTKPEGCIDRLGRNGCTGIAYVDAPYALAVSPDSRFVYAYNYDNDALQAFTRTLPPDDPSGGGGGSGEAAAAVPKAKRVAWTRKGRVVRARFLATAGVTYRLTATKGQRTRAVRCTTRTRLKALRGTCVVRRLTAGRWRFALTPTLNGVQGDPTRKALRIRARR